MNENTCPILLVEDNENDIYFMKRAFKKAAISNTLHVVRDGQAAIDFLSGVPPFDDHEKFQSPCLVLLDLKLPIKGGLEVLSWIRAQPELRALIVIILSTSREPNDITTAYRIGVNAYLVKPNDVTELMQMVESLKTFWLQFNQFPSSHD